jgi:restriction endonuclease S subunit
MYGQGKTRGSVALLHTEATINQAFAAVIPSECIDPLYLFSFLDSAYQQLRSLSQGSNQENLSVSLLKAFPVPLPPLAVQRRLGTSMAEAHDMASAAQAHMEKLMGVRRLLIEVLLSSEG